MRLAVRLQLLLFIAILLASATASAAAESVRLYRDTYGVPHVFANSMAAAYYGAGYAVAEDLGWGVSQLALKAEGRQAEFFGHTGTNLEEDIYAHHFHFYKDALQNFSCLSPETQLAFRAYAAGIAARYKDMPGPRPEWAIDVTPEHLAASFLQANFYQSAFESWPYELSDKEIGVRLPYPYMGSNAFAVGPGKTADGSTIHFAGPQTPFGDCQSEIALQWPGGRIAGYGYGLFVDPGLGLHDAWGATANWPDTADGWKFRLDDSGPDREGFFWDPKAGDGKGGWSEMGLITFTLKIKGEAPHLYRRWETPYGPVLRISENKWAYVWRPSGWRRIEYVDAILHKQWAPSMREGMSAANPPEVASGNWVMAGDNGDVGFLYAGRVPVRGDNAEYHSLLSGDNPRSQWLGGYWGLGGQAALPAVLNPASAFVVSANEAPWCATTSGEIAGRDHWPVYLVPESGWGSQATVRGERLRQLIEGGGKRLTVDAAAKIPFDVAEPKTQLWIQGLQKAWQSAPSKSPLTKQAQQLQVILTNWNGQASVDSPGMAAAFFLVQEMKPWASSAEAAFAAAPAPPTDADVVAYGKALEAVSIKMDGLYGKLAVPWGQIHGMAIGGKWVPLAGGTEYLPAILMTHGGYGDSGDTIDGDGRIRCSQGSVYMALTIFGAGGTVKRYTIAPAGQHNPNVYPHSPHCTDQTALFAAGQWKAFYLMEEEVKAHLAADTGTANDPFKGEEVLEAPVSSDKSD